MNAVGRASALLTCFGTATAAASESADGSARGDSMLDLAAFAAVADADLKERDQDVAAFNGFGVQLALRYGNFISANVLFCGQLQLGHLRTTSPTVYDPFYFQSQRIGSDAYTIVTAGPFLGFYPSLGSGLFFGVGAGFGVMYYPAFASAGGSIAARYELEAGYQFSSADQHPLDLVFRYGAAAGDELITSEHPDSLTSQQLEVGLRYRL